MSFWLSSSLTAVRVELNVDVGPAALEEMPLAVMSSWALDGYWRLWV